MLFVRTIFLENIVSLDSKLLEKPSNSNEILVRVKRKRGLFASLHLIWNYIKHLRKISEGKKLRFSILCHITPRCSISLFCGNVQHDGCSCLWWRSWSRGWCTANGNMLALPWVEPQVCGGVWEILTLLSQLLTTKYFTGGKEFGESS